MFGSCLLQVVPVNTIDQYIDQHLIDTLANYLALYRPRVDQYTVDMSANSPSTVHWVLVEYQSICQLVCQPSVG